MIQELLNFIWMSLLKLIGIGIKGIGEFEDGEEFRRKINLRIQKGKDDDFPLFEGKLIDIYKIAEEINGILLLIFLNPNDGDSLEFEKLVLKDENFRNQIREISFKTPMIALSDISNHYHFMASKQFSIRKFPAIVIKTKYQNKFQTVLCYEGFINAKSLVGLIQSVLLACESEIAQSAEISAMRALQSEQDAAYLKSLEIDKEKLLRKRVTHVKVEDDPETIFDDNKLLKERISKAYLDFEDEPSNNSEGNFKFQFLFPDGTRKIRSFSSNSTTKVKENIKSSGVELRSEKIAIKSIEPRIEFVEKDDEIIELKGIEGIGKGIKLFIEYI